MDNSNEPKTKKNGQTAAETILARLPTGQRFIERGLGERQKNACKRFIDGSENATNLIYDDDNFDGVGILPSLLEVGNVNYLAINISTKNASIAIGDPDFHVDTGSDDPLLMQQNEGQEQPNLSKQDMAEVVRRFLKTLWEMKGWVRPFRKTLLMRSLCGMGLLAYLWHDEDGPLFEHFRAKDFACDPCVTDWRNMRWAARRIRMPRAEARARYPKIGDMVVAANTDIPNLDEPSPMSRDTVELWVYWDKNTEATCYGSEVLEQGPNLYGRIPILVMEGDIAPESEFSLGDYDAAAGLQEMLARLQSMMNSQAENGGSIGWYIPALLDDMSKNAFENGRPQEFIAVQTEGSDMMGYIPSQPSDPMLMEAFNLASKGMDAATGVNEYMRGVINQSAKFATEAAMLNNQSGARGNQARIEYEQFVNYAARCLLHMVMAFGPSMMQDGDPNDALLLESIGAVQDIKVIESSTAYKDPNQEMQTNLQLLQAMMPFIQAGMVNALPLIADVFRAFGKRDVQKYLNLQPQTAPGQASGAQPGQGGQMPPPGSPAPPGGPPQAEPVPAGGSPAPTPPGGQGPQSNAAPAEVNVTNHFHGAGK